MCGIPSIFVTFSTKLVSPVLEFERESYCTSGFVVSVKICSSSGIGLSGPSRLGLSDSQDCSNSAKDLKATSFVAYWSFPEYPILVDSDYPIVKDCSNSAKDLKATSFVAYWSFSEYPI